MQPITAEIVQNLIESFWKLNAGRAPLSDFLPIVDHEGFFMELAGTDVRFSGIAGLGDHQMGKLIFFDQEFILLDIQIEVDGDTALARTKAQWHASTWTSPDPYSQRIKVALLHTWYVGRAKDDSRPSFWATCAKSFTICPALHPRNRQRSSI
jgi:hypothetical protein